MKNLISIDPIAVKDKNDVVRALTILERLGIKRMTEEQKHNYLVDDKKTVNNNFMIQEKDGGFRIQSHYIGFGIPVEDLENQVNHIFEKHPDISERLTEIQEREKKLTEEINTASIKIEELRKSYSIIDLKEKK